MPNFFSNVNSVLWWSYCTKIRHQVAAPLWPCPLPFHYVYCRARLWWLVRLVNYPFKTKPILVRVSKSTINFHLSLRCRWDKIIFWNSWYSMYTYIKWCIGKVQASTVLWCSLWQNPSFITCRWDKIIFWNSWYSMYTYVKWCIGKVQAPFCDAA